jgi:hypothetical protein
VRASELEGGHSSREVIPPTSLEQPNTLLQATDWDAVTSV